MLRLHSRLLEVADDETDGEDGGGGQERNNSSRSGAGAFLIPVTGFAPNTVTELNPASRPAYNSTNLTIKIPAIKVNTSIVGVQLKNGNWDVSWLQNQVGWLNGTAYPTWTGNSVLMATCRLMQMESPVYFPT